MNTKKLNFSSIKNTLSRSELKQIMAGSGSGDGSGSGSTCEICLGGVDCHPASPGQGGKYGCKFVPYPVVSCEFSGGSCTG